MVVMKKKINKDFLIDFCNVINQDLLIKQVKENRFDIQEKDINDKDNISGLVFTYYNNENKLALLKQNEEHKPKKSLLLSHDSDYKYQTSQSCDFIAMYIKDGDLRLAFCEIKSSESGFEKGVKQIQFSKLWFKYLCDCYCKSYNKNLEILEQAINKSKSFLITRLQNDTHIKKPIGLPLKNQNFNIQKYNKDVDIIKLYCKKNKRLVLDNIEKLFG